MWTCEESQDASEDASVTISSVSDAEEREAQLGLENIDEKAVHRSETSNTEDTEFRAEQRIKKIRIE
jgi:hypothetical protein